MDSLLFKSIMPQIENFLLEDDLHRDDFYLHHLPQENVRCFLKLKSSMTLAGLPYFYAVFKYLDPSFGGWDYFANWEGKEIQLGKEEVALNFILPFNVALTGERLALNLLQRASSIATFTRKYVEKAQKYNIVVLDTRKTTPGLRSLEKYAVRMGGGHTHRLGQTDVWMVKDNHKKFFGGLQGAIQFFEQQRAFYRPIVVEIHSLEEFKEAVELKVRHVLLDNFSPPKVRAVLELKPKDMTLEISGGIRLENLDQYLIEGVSALSIGGLTYAAPPVDMSLKFEKM